ncbi:hypothetical protein Daus18300_012888 [Diaporthe australafricana]|uniref:Uncharacterized protein n=1 Tax=Diaporthe australafricana TaxID=127596 RepID=A0ABR3W1C2_9PEZI
MADFLIGTGQVQLKNLRLESWSWEVDWDPREEINTPSDQLQQVFEDNCEPFAYENRIPVALFPEELEEVLKESRVSIQDIVSSRDDAPPKLYPQNGIRCIHGRQRLAAIHVKGPDWWWGVHIYCVPHGSDISQLLHKEVDQYYFQTRPTDGLVFLQIALKAIEAREDLLEKLDRLRPFPGLWAVFHLGNIEKYLALHTLSEILHYLELIYVVWEWITLGEPWVREAADEGTVRGLERRAPQCEADRRLIRQLMGTGVLFKKVSDPVTRQKIQERILQLPQILIPSIRTFQENMKWLTVGVQILKDTVIDKLGKKEVREAMRDCWIPPQRCLLEVGRDDNDVEIPAPPVFELAYQQVFIAALREFPRLSSAFTPRREKGQTAKMPRFDEAYLAAFLRGAHKQGFRSTKIQAGLLHAGEAAPRRGPAKPLEVDPSLVNTSPERRCGRPFANTYLFLESRLFLANLLTLDEA